MPAINPVVLRMERIVKEGPIDTDLELLDRANVVLYNHLTRMQEPTRADVEEGYLHPDTAQVLARAYLQMENLKRLILQSPTFNFESFVDPDGK